MVESGATAASSPREVAENCEIIITMLPASQHVQAVVLGEQGILSGAKEGSIIIDMSSITPAVSIALAEEAAKKASAFWMHPLAAENLKPLMVR